jgi:flavin-binding protein dodecin
MSVARVTELSSTSETSFEDAINQAISRATETLRGVEGAWVKDMNVLIENGRITGYKVNLAVTFVLEDAEGAFQEMEELNVTDQGTGGKESTGGS